MENKRRKFRADIAREIRNLYYAEERERNTIAKALQGMGWSIEEREPHTRPVSEPDFLRVVYLTAYETADENSASISVEWTMDKVLMTVLSDPNTHLYSEELDVADDESGNNNSGTPMAIMAMVQEAVEKLAAQ
jgi:hypothetical protein